jgi:hypothetical protein
MKNILSNLTESEKNRILEMHKFATRKLYLKESADESVDTSSINATLKEINDLCKTIPLMDKEPSDCYTYLTSGYFFALASGDAGHYIGSQYGGINTSNKDNTIKNSDLVLCKNDTKNVFSKKYSYEVVCVANTLDAPEITKNNIEDQLKNFATCIESINKKSKVSALSVLEQIKTKLNTLTSQMATLMGKFDYNDDRKFVVTSGFGSFDLQIVDSND